MKFFPLILALVSWPAFAGSAQTLLTPDQIYHQIQATKPPPGIEWSPDGTRVSYLASNGDLVAVEGSTGDQQVLVDHDRMRALSGPSGSERDQSNRERYNLPSYTWVPDSRHLLFDSSGQLWFFDLATRTGVQLATTGAGAGDDPKFSPDSASLAYIRNHNLYVTRMRDPRGALHLTNTEDANLLNGEVDWVYEEELDVRSNYFWSPDSRRIAYLQMNENPVPQYPLVDWTPTHASVERQSYPQPGDSNPRLRLGVVSAEGGRTRWIRLPLDDGNDYLPRFGWLDAKTLWFEILTRNHKKLTLYFADVANDSVKPVWTQTDDTFLDENYDITFLPDSFLLTSWKSGHNHIYLYRFNAANPTSAEATEVRQVTSGNWEAGDILGVNAVNHTVYYLSNEGNPTQQQIWVTGLDGEGKHQVSRSGEWHEPVFSANTNFFVDTVSSTSTPPVLDLCRHQTNCQTIWRAPAVTPAMTQPVALELKAADGDTTLYAQLLQPPGKSASARVPLIVNPYGGPHVQIVTGEWDAQQRLFDQVLLEHGYAVLHVDNRGTGGRGRNFAQAAYHNFGPVQFGDQLAALDQVLRAYPQLDGKRLGWWGWSWGGSFTLYAMTHSDRFRAGVAVAPVTDFADYDSIYTERYLGLPSLNREFYQQASLLESAANLKGRLLLVQGTGDDNVHLENTVQFVDRLVAARLPYDLQIYPRKLHGIEGPDATTHLFTRILDHFETHLGPQP